MITGIFQTPDLVPLIVDDEWIGDVKKDMPELPDAKKARFIDEYQLSAYDAEVLTSSRQLAEYFEETATDLKDKKQAAHWVMGSVLALIKTEGAIHRRQPDFSICPCTAFEASGTKPYKCQCRKNGF